MTNKIIVTGIIGILVVVLVFLGAEVKRLGSEVNRLSKAASPIAKIDHQPARQQPIRQQPTRQQPIRQQPTRQQPNRQVRSRSLPPDDPWVAFDNSWDPYFDLAQIQRQMNQLFREASQGGGIGYSNTPAGNSYALSTDIQDAKDKYIVRLDIPGMEKENINVEVKNKTLFVSGERSNADEEENNNYYRQERSFGYFSKALPLPDDADASGISVAYKSGVLTIEIPKLAKAATQEEPSIKIKVD